MNAPRQKEFLLTDADFAFLSKLVYKETGIVLAEHKRNMLYSRLTKRLRALQLRDFEQYCNYVTNHLDKELINLVNAVTTNLTAFFREEHHFEFLSKTVFPELAARKRDKTIRIWSAGCSTGAEPYSIAMELATFLKSNPGWDAKILATDIDTNMLARGRSGEYRIEDLKSIPQRHRKWVSVKKREGEQGIVMAHELRRLITFNQLNLLDERWPMKRPFDVIFCRNVVIYFDKETQKKLFARYAKQLHEDGWLFIGHSESLHKVSDAFTIVGRTTYTRKPA